MERSRINKMAVHSYQKHESRWTIILTLLLTLNVIILIGVAVVYFYISKDEITTKCHSCNESLSLSSSSCCSENQLKTAQNFEKASIF